MRATRQRNETNEKSIDLTVRSQNLGHVPDYILRFRYLAEQSRDHDRMLQFRNERLQLFHHTIRQNIDCTCWFICSFYRHKKQARVSVFGEVGVWFDGISKYCTEANHTKDIV